MSISKENAKNILESINLQINGIESIENKDNFETIRKIAFIKYKEIEGRLIWDYGLLLNELTFIDNSSGKHYSLGASNHSNDVAEVFYALAKDYETDNHKHFSNITIVHGNVKAKESAEKLYNYISRAESNIILLCGSEYHYLTKRKQLYTNKVIVLGQDSFERDIIKKIGKKKIGPGLEIGYNRHICILRTDRSAYKKNEDGRKIFKYDYENKIKEMEESAKELDISLQVGNNRVSVSMYNLLILTFIAQKYMDDFLKSEYISEFNNKEDALCMELKNTPEYKTYITPELLKGICEIQKHYSKPPKHKVNEYKNAWIDLYKTDNNIWSIQRYWINDYCRVSNSMTHVNTYGTVEQILGPILEYCRRRALLEKITNRDWGIVLCGGGGKGAYHIGVWKWLIENGVADKINGVSGASVGAINSLLFVEGNYELAEEIWSGVDSSIIFERNGLPILQTQDALSDLLDKYLNKMDNITQNNKLVYSSVTYGSKISFNAVAEYLKKKVVIKDEQLKADYYSWSHRSKDEIKEIVLASAAIPAIKKARLFEGMEFVDGGFADNVPLYPLVEDGFQNIIIIHLDRNKKAFDKSIMNLDTSNVKFYHVYPTESLGDMREANPALNKYRMDLGYKDADSQLKEILSI